MKARILLALVGCLLAVCLSSYAQDYSKVLKDHIQSRRKGDAITVLSTKKTGDYTYSGLYCVIKAPSLIAYQYYAFIKGGRVEEFSEITDDNQVIVLTFDEKSFVEAKNSNFSFMPKYTIESKAEYDARIKREGKTSRGGVSK